MRRLLKNRTINNMIDNENNSTKIKQENNNFLFSLINLHDETKIDISLKNNLVKYNELLNEINNNITKELTLTDFSILKEYFTEEKINKIIILNTNTNIEIYLVSNNNIKFIIENKETFKKIILPEILKLYSSKIDAIKKENKLKYFNKTFYDINKELYILNFYDEIVEYNIKFLNALIDKKNYQLELNKNITIETDVYNESEKQQETKKLTYSYGYINILLISLILSLITIIVCLLKI